MDAFLYRARASMSRCIWPPDSSTPSLSNVRSREVSAPLGRLSTFSARRPGGGSHEAGPRQSGHWGCKLRWKTAGRRRQILLGTPRKIPGSSPPGRGWTRPRRPGGFFLWWDDTDRTGASPGWTFLAPLRPPKPAFPLGGGSDFTVLQGVVLALREYWKYTAPAAAHWARAGVGNLDLGRAAVF